MGRDKDTECYQRPYHPKQENPCNSLNYKGFLHLAERVSASSKSKKAPPNQKQSCKQLIYMDFCESSRTKRPIKSNNIHFNRIFIGRYNGVINSTHRL
mgnify:CR=1 FL=1